MRARCFIVRFADDFIIGCESQSDANRIMEVLPKRFNRFKLTIHPQKTKLVKFAKPSYSNQFGKDNETFDFHGFTHYWAKSRRGYWVICEEDNEEAFEAYRQSNMGLVSNK